MNEKTNTYIGFIQSYNIIGDRDKNLGEEHSGKYKTLQGAAVIATAQLLTIQADR